MQFAICLFKHLICFLILNVKQGVLLIYLESCKNQELHARHPKNVRFVVRAFFEHVVLNITDFCMSKKEQILSDIKLDSSWIISLITLNTFEIILKSTHL